MRHWLIPLLGVLAVAALGVWPGSVDAIVCPQRPHATTQPCCGPPTAAADAAACCTTACCATACCTTACCSPAAAQPACPPQPLTGSSSPNPSVEGRKVTISGQLTGGSAGTTVYLWQRLAGQASFQRVAQTTTTAGGSYTIVRGSGVVTTNASWYTTTSGATSATWSQDVSARIKLVKWVITGTLVKLTGLVSPSHAGERVSLQRFVARRWRTIAGSVIGPSKFSVRHRFAPAGSVLLRVTFAGDMRNARSASASLRILVR